MLHRLRAFWCAKRTNTGTVNRSLLFLTGLLAATWIAYQGYAALALPLAAANVKATPLSLTVFSSASLPPEVKAEEARTAPFLFDRDTTNEHVAYAAQQVDAAFDSPQQLRFVKVYGAAPYTLTVRAEVNGAFVAVTGLENLNLAALPAGWTAFPAGVPVTTGKLQFALTPVTGSTATGLKEIEIWASGEPLNVADGAMLLSRLLADPASAPQGRFYAATNASTTPNQGVIGGSPDDPADNGFGFTLDRDPAHFVRAYLTYELNGQFHWVGAVRAVNGNPAQGGVLQSAGTGEWAMQVERINPAWLKAGANTVAFSVTAGASGPYQVRNVRLVAELESGANLVDVVTSNQPDTATTNPVASVFDGDTNTGWQPYPANQPINAQAPTVEFLLNKPTQMDAVAAHFSLPIEGNLRIEVLRAGQWITLSESTTGAVPSGWNMVTVPSTVPLADRVVDGVRLTFLGGYVSSARLTELLFYGSGIGPRQSPPRIYVTYPEQGEFYGRSAYIRGFVTPVDNGSGAAAIAVAGKSVAHVDGAFGAWITKDEAGFGAQGDAEAWSVDVKAIYPNYPADPTAQTVTTVALTKQVYPIAPLSGTVAGSTSQLVSATTNATQAVTIAHDESTLEIVAGALTTDTSFTVKPLKGEELPALDTGMVNVTKGPRRGYRFLPHGMKFAKKVNVKLKYQKSLVPPGHTEQDIKTYYFDEQAGSWKELERVGVDTQSQTVTSLTDHFTDMINAVVTVPDHAQLASFNPTSLKDIKAADPGAQVNLIDPPGATGTGDARLSYPIEMPAGRQGLQPQLAVQYNSGGGNGWMGLGWDLPAQSISIDTRWGVPRYDTGQLDGTPRETESYLLSGESLTPVAHRGELRARNASGDRIFHTRVEGQFRRIIRHGNTPSAYWWEVLDKNGTRYFYGGAPEIAGGVDKDAILSDPRAAAPAIGNVFQWYLREVRDTNGNSIRYFYDVVTNTAGEPWRQAYLKSIRYTGRPGVLGPYEVVFNRAGGRSDVTVDGRPGFKTVMDQRLASIDVRLTTDASPLIRRYVFDYVAGQFGKTLLAKVTQYGTDGTTAFNHHRFEYYDEVKTATAGALAGFKDSVAISGATTVRGDSLTAGQNSTAFGANASRDSQGHFYGGISYGSGSKTVSLGLKVGTQSGTSKTLLAFQDINGDGLPDQVYRTAGGIVYRLNQGGPAANPGFAPESPAVPGLGALGLEESKTRTFGGQVFAGASAIFDKSLARTKGKTYLSDLNGDGLPDLVDNGVVRFNHLVNGVPEFRDTSPTPLGSGAAADATGLVQNHEELRAEMEAAYYLVDPIRRWVAPYSGSITISGSARLLAAPPADYLTADGVRVTIQHNGSEQWLAVIGPKDLAAKPVTTSAGTPLTLTVAAGDRIYFRVNSVNDGLHDAVEFNPTITYSQVNGATVDTTKTDENGMPLYVYTPASDYAYGGRPMPFTAPVTGTATLEGSLVKTAAISDDLVLQILHKGAVIHTQTIAAAQTGSFPVTLGNLSLAQADSLLVRLHADTRVDLSGVRFAPKITYATVSYNGEPAQPAPTDPDTGAPLFVFHPPVTAQIFPRLAATTPYAPWVAPATGTIQVTQTLAMQKGSIPADFATDVTLAVKRNKQPLARKLVTVRGKTITGSLTASIAVTAGDVLYFTADATAANTPSYVIVNAPQVAYGGGSAVSVPHDVHLGIDGSPAVAANVVEAFGGGFRGFWYGQYNGNPVTNADGSKTYPPIDEARLRLPTEAEARATGEAAANNSPTRYFVGMIPFPGADQFGAFDVDCWVSGPRMSASRYMEKYLDFDNGATLGGARGIARLGGSKNTVVSISAGAFGASQTDGTNWSDVDFFDFNGDRYPDVVGGGAVQSTLPNGALHGNRDGVGAFGRVRFLTSDNRGINMGATSSGTKTDSKGRVQGQNSEMASYNVSVGTTGSAGRTDTNWDLVDVNGDGLPDYVAPAAGGVTVRLNLGYRFGQPETWTTGASLFRLERTVSVGASVGGGGGGSSSSGSTDWAYGFGGGVNQNRSQAVASRDFIDVNGDGLADMVVKPLDGVAETAGASSASGLYQSTASALTVQFNTGNGFANAVSYQGSLPRPLRENTVFNRGVGVHFTISIGPFYGIYIVLNPGFNRSASLGGYEVMLADFNGDGYTDHLVSDTSGNVNAVLNNHGRTNLLRKVYRPLGSDFTLHYERTGNTVDQPQSRWALGGVVLFDGHIGEGVDHHVTTFQHTAGRYDRAEREFLGFKACTETQHQTAGFAPGATTSLAQLRALPVYRKVERTYLNTTFYNKGLPETETLLDGTGAKFTETVNAYTLVDVADGAAVPGLADYSATRFPALTRTDKRFYEGTGSAGKSTYTTHAYDEYGNVTGFVDAADLGAGDDVYATIGYSAAQAGCLDPHYIVGKATSLVVRNSAAGPVLRSRTAVVDCAGGTGNVMSVAVETGSGAAVTDLAYHADGNVKTVKGPLNHRNTETQRYTLAYEYDPVVATHVTRIADSFGLASTATHDYKFGRPVTTVDTNAQQTTWFYDAFGRADKVIGPYEVGESIATLDFDYTPTVATAGSGTGGGSDGATAPLTTVHWARTAHADKDATGAYKPSGTIDTVLLIDGLKRVLQTKKDISLHKSPSSAAEARMSVSGCLVFDAFGRTVESRYPTSEAKGQGAAANTAYNSACNPIAAHTAYDVLDRVRETKTPATATSFFTTTLAYGFGADRNSAVQFETTVTDANGIQKKTYRDVGGSITTVREWNRDGATTQTIETSYAYDPLKQIVEVKDNLGNLTKAAYDLAGRRISLDNPDTGLTAYGFDPAGNLTTKVTANHRAKNQTVQYAYDQNRLVSVSYPGFPGNNLTYEYGAATLAGDANGNRAGRLTKTTSQMGTEERTYGQLGEVVKEVKTVVTYTTPNSPEVYTTQYKYDTFGRLLKLTYPDAEVLTYTYDAGGNLESARGLKNGYRYRYFERLEYDEFEQRVYLINGNNIAAVWNYDPYTRRLAGLTAGKDELFLNLAYTYDNVGNVKSLANNVPVPPASQMGGPTLQSFVYDDLYRLTQASGTFQYAPDKTHAYTLGMGYDTIHNITAKAQAHAITQPSGVAIPQHKTSYTWSYAYGAPGPASVRPHAPLQVGPKASATAPIVGRSFTYDANGNQLGWTDDQNGTRRTIVWDDENRIQSLFDNGHEKTYKYDDQGNRVIKRGPQGETVYVNQWFTIRNKEIGTKHVYAGTTRVLSKLMKQDKPGANPQGKTPYEKDLYFYHPDHLGSSSYVTDAQGKRYEHLEYFPFGETWVEESSNTQRTPYLFTSKELDEETGLYYFGARYYDPRTSVWQSGDPILGKYLPSGNKDQDKSLSGMGGVYNPLNIGLYSYGHLNPIKFIDPDGKESVVKDGKVYINPENKTVPSISMPNNVGAKGFSRSEFNFHTYDVTTRSVIRGSQEGASAVGQGIANRPVPTGGQSASPEGTINNAGSIPTAGDVNMVRTFLVPSPDPSKFTDITVNYTISGAHGLDEGFVMRYGEIGSNGNITLRSYGEGNAWRQNELLKPLWGSEVENVWQGSQQQIIKEIIQNRPDLTYQ